MASTDPVVPFLLAGGDPNWKPRKPVLMPANERGRLYEAVPRFSGERGGGGHARHAVKARTHQGRKKLSAATLRAREEQGFAEPRDLVRQFVATRARWY